MKARLARSSHPRVPAPNAMCFARPCSNGTASRSSNTRPRSESMKALSCRWTRRITSICSGRRRSSLQLARSSVMECSPTTTYPGSGSVAAPLASPPCIISSPGTDALVVGSTAETLGHADVLSSAGVEVQAIVTPEPQSLRRDTTNLATDRPLVEGNLVEAKGRKRLGAAVVRLADGTKRTFGCDSLVLSIGLVPRDALLRQATGPWLSGVGDVVDPGCDLDAAIQAGRTVGAGLQHPARVRPRQRLAADRLDGFVCVCEDVEARDLRDAWSEGFRSTELLKRYTTTCMGPCQGALCQPFLREFVASKMPGDGPQAAQTTSRPPSRPLRLEDAAAGRHRDLEERTALHDRHLALGARMERVGRWSRPESYGSTTDEYWAVRNA